MGNRLGTGGAIICSNAVSAVGVVIMLAAALAPTGWAAAAVLAAGQFCHGWAMGVSNSHEMSYRQALTPDELQARTNTTMRSLNRAVLVIASPIAGLVADQARLRPSPRRCHRDLRSVSSDPGPVSVPASPDHLKA